jgi:hypothetical protein
MCGFYKEVDIFAAEEPVRRVVNRIEKLDPQWVHPMHGGSLPRDVIPDYTRALKDEPSPSTAKCLDERYLAGSSLVKRRERGPNGPIPIRPIQLRVPGSTKSSRRCGPLRDSGREDLWMPARPIR